MTLTIYNTLSRKEEPFVPADENSVKMYVCGPTVYDLLHVGNFRGAIFFNLVRNWLEEGGRKVTYVYNYTDVDDKIISRAQREGVDASVIGDRYIEEFRRDFAALKMRPHDHNPRVTDFIPKIVSFVEKLIERSHAYVIDGEVFYSVESFSDYGNLSGKDLEGLEAGKRVEKDDKKKNPADFVLWKPSGEGIPGWESPWGRGRPGWHIECSCMIDELLGESIDIHGGGIDLIFPHHENEIAQGEGKSGKKYCRYWMHNNFINFQGTGGEEEKMSKSLGNVITARRFMEQYHPEILKFLILSVHYRSVLGLGDEKIEQAIGALGRIYSALGEAEEVVVKGVGGGKPSKVLEAAIKKADKDFAEALDSDFNTGKALAAIFELVRVFNGEKLLKKLRDPASGAGAEAFRRWIVGRGDLMSLFQEPANSFLDELDGVLLRQRGLERETVEDLVAKREAARATRDWASADSYREELAGMGIELQDGKGLRSWRVKIKEVSQ